MRTSRSVMLAMAALLSGCGLKRLLPEGPVLDADARREAFAQDRPSGAGYTGPAEVPFPILPVQVFGATYALDLVIVSRHPDWDMHELARIDRPEGPLWIAKDARAGTLDQVIVADLPDIDAWMPEIPVERVQGPVRVTDRSTPERVDVAVAYTNASGQAAALTYEGRPPVTAQRQRNGSTMGHSARQVVAVLDVPFRTFGRRSSITIDGAPIGTRRILGVIPFRAALVQTQGGLAITDLTQTGAAGAFDTAWRMRSGATVTRRWEVTTSGGYVDAWQRAPERDLHYRYLVTGDAWELLEAESIQAGQSVPTAHVRLSPALPDLRRPFPGRHTSRFVVDVNGQGSHAVGELTAWWQGDTVVVDIAPTAPWWVADRPMQTRVRIADGAARVVTDRAGDP